MEIFEDKVPIFEVLLGMEGSWLDEMVESIPLQAIELEKITVTLLKAPKVTPVSNAITINLLLKTAYALKVGMLTGVIQTKVNCYNLADMEDLKVKVEELEWLEGPRFEWGNRLGFSVKRLVKKQLEAFEQELGPILERQLPAQFIKHTSTHPFYLSYLKQQITQPNLQVNTSVKEIYYRIISRPEFLELRFFPDLEITLSDETFDLEVSAGPMKPGVGGGQLKFKCILSQSFINQYLIHKLIGKRFSAGNRAATIEAINMSIGTEGMAAKVQFEKEEMPGVSALLIPVLNVKKQEIGLDVQHIKMDKTSWLLKGIFNLFRKNIENRIEENLRLSVKELLENNKLMIEEELNQRLKPWGLHLHEFNPGIALTRLYPSAGHLILQGQLGGIFNIIGKGKTV